MYLNGMGLRGIERVTDIHHTTILHWVRAAGLSLPDAPESEEIPEISDLDELQTDVANKRNKVWIWTAVNHFQTGILARTVGDRSKRDFQTSVANCQMLQVLLLCHRRMAGVPDIYPGWRLYCQQDLYDSR